MEVMGLEQVKIRRVYFGEPGVGLGRGNEIGKETR